MTGSEGCKESNGDGGFEGVQRGVYVWRAHECEDGKVKGEFGGPVRLMQGVLLKLLKLLV